LYSQINEKGEINHIDAAPRRRVVPARRRAPLLEHHQERFREASILMLVMGGDRRAELKHESMKELEDAGVRPKIASTIFERIVAARSIPSGHHMGGKSLRAHQLG
jgi:hypothetical protein